MLANEEENPWNVDSLYDLQFFNCPSPFCIYKNNSKQEFVNHAFYFHPESEHYLRNLKDYSLSDVEIPTETKVNSNQLDIKTESDDTKVSNKKSIELLYQVKKENYCNQCDIQFCNQDSLQDHVSSIHPYLEVQFNNHEDDFSPDDEKYNLCEDENSEIEKNHQKIHRGKVHKCEECSKEFSRGYHLRRHLQMGHNVVKKDYKGESCNESFSNE